MEALCFSGAEQRLSRRWIVGSGIGLKKKARSISERAKSFFGDDVSYTERR
jgi:hypothetical protein